MSAPIDIPSAPRSPPLFTPVLPPDASVEDYEAAIEVERAKYDQIVAVRDRLLAQYERIHEACGQVEQELGAEQRDTAVAGGGGGGSDEQRRDVGAGTNGHVGEDGSQQQQSEGEKESSKGQNSTLPSSTSSTPPHLRAHHHSRSSLNAEAPEFVPGFSFGGASDNPGNSVSASSA